MKRVLGVSLVELMVSMGVVSVIGAGMYVGFQQLDSASQVARQVYDNENQSGLLLDLIEQEAGLAGQGVTNGRGVCLVAPSGSELVSDCDGALITTADQSHGVTTCRKVDGQFQTTLFYTSGPIAYDADIHKDLRCNDAKGPFFNSYSVTATDPNECVIPSLSDISDANLRAENLCEMEFSRSRGGISVDLLTSGRLTQQSDGNNFTFSNQASLRESIVATTAETLVQLDDPYLVQLEQGQFYAASGATASARVWLDRVALETLTVDYVVRGSDGTVLRECSVTFNQGDISAGIPQSDATGDCALALSAGQTIEIIGNNLVVADGITEFEALDLADAPASPVLSYTFTKREVTYGQGAITFGIVSDRELPSTNTVYLTAENVEDPTIKLGSMSTSPASLEEDGTALNTTSSGPSSTLADTYPLTFALNDRTGIELIPGTDDSLGDQTFRLGLILVSGSQTIEMPLNQGDVISVLEEGPVPEVRWLRTDSVAKEPVAGETRSITLTLMADPIPESDINVGFSVGGTGISCGAATTDDFDVVALTATSASCSNIGIGAAQQRATIELTLKPHEGLRSAASANEAIVLTLASGTGYLLSEDRYTHEAQIEEEQVPQLLAASTARVSTFAGQSRAHNLATASINDFQTATTPPTIRVQDGRQAILVYEEATSDEAWAAGSIPITLNDVDIGGNGSIYVKVASAAGALSNEHLTYGTDFVIGSTVASAIQVDEAFEITFNDSSNDSESSNPSVPFWVYNDLDEEGDERISLYIHRATGQGLTRSPDTDADGYSIDVTVIDRDQCAIAGDGMTIGDSITDDFHTVDSDDMVNANLTAATVRISSGYDSTNDKLVVAGDAQTASLTTSESNGVITYTSAVVEYPAGSGTDYDLSAQFFTAQGVLEISTTNGTIPAPAMVKFFNESVKFQTTAAGTTNREATFTLGNAQAWNAHEDGHTHYYRFVPGTLIHFDTAKTDAAADANSYFGVPGYLATVTSRAENTFLAEKFNVNGNLPAGWLGGWDDTENKWEWMNGPEQGRRFLSSNTECGTNYHVIRGEGNGLGNTAPITRNAFNQTIEINGSTHETNSWSLGSDHQNMRYDEYRETIDSVTGRVKHLVSDSNNNLGPYRFSNFGNCEPNDAGPYEDKLQMTGNGVGGRLWNDLPGDLNTITGAYAASDSPYSVSGYYQEFGGPERSKWGFYNRKFSQTNNFQTGLCNVTDATPAAASCTAYSDLTIGMDDDGSGGFNFYGPGTDVAGAMINDGRVSISSGYMSGTDSLQIDGHPLSPTSTSSQKKYVNFSIEHNNTPIHGLNATFFVNEGVMEIETATAIPTEAMVKVFSERVKLVINDLTDTSERQVTYTLGEAQAWFNHPDRGDRYYRYISGNHDWDDARDLAENNAHRYFGIRGYLATITSFAENQFLAQKFNDNGGPPSGWLGANDWGTDGHWQWVRGPERYMRFWQGNGNSGQHITGAFSSGTTSTHDGQAQTTTINCTAQDETWNDNPTPASGHTQRLDWGYSETLEDGIPVASGAKRFAFWSCNSSGSPEPNNSGNGAEDYLQMQGSAAGGGMWNDLRNSAGETGTYGVKGYYVEYGGPSTWSENYFDRKLGQTMSINPVSCEMEPVDNMGCLPGTGLTIGSTSSFDFYGPNSDVVSANITGARVQIIQNFVSNSNTDRDELALRGAQGELINGNKTKRYQDIPLINLTQLVDVDGEYDFVSGVLKVTADSAVPASAMVTFLSQRVQLIEAGSSTGAKDISFTLGDALIWNGHEDNVQRYYRFVSDVGGTWTNARSNAQSSAQNYFGVPGYLATITSKAENDFIAESFSNDGSPVAGWLGGSDNRSSGVWEWVTGPEGGNTSVSGTTTSNRIKFWDGNSGTTTKPVNLSGTSITGTPPTSGHSMLTNSTGCSLGDAACCQNQYSGYHGQTPAEATAAATELGQSGTALTHHFFGYTESVDANGQVTPNSSKRFANWACNGSTPQPSDSSGQNFLLITGSPLGNGMWNDVDDDGITSSADIYAQQGYYVEYGGGTVAGGGSWSHNFTDRRIGRVIRIPQGCEVPDAGFTRID